MKDFADVPNSDGTFPDVVAVDSSGPGEVDGTALIADTLTDDWGWKQALLTDVGATPSGSEETSSTSQILDALKSMVRNIESNHSIPMTDGESVEAGGWLFGDDYWESDLNFGYIFFPIRLPYGLDAQTVYVDLLISPGAARTGTDRVRVTAHYKEFVPLTVSAALDTEYDDGTTGDFKYITVSFSATTTDAGVYLLAVKAGNTAGTNHDAIAGGRVRLG